MRISKTLIALASAAALVMAMPMTAGAATKKGTWTYTDVTPDPTTLQDPATQHCSGDGPTSPTDVNVHTFKAPARGTLKLTAHNAADWAMEIRNARGVTLGGTDGELPNDAENYTMRLSRGKYQVVYCNFAGEPQITVNYSFKY